MGKTRSYRRERLIVRKKNVHDFPLLHDALQSRSVLAPNREQQPGWNSGNFKIEDFAKGMDRF